MTASTKSNRTGRASRVRDFLSTQSAPRTAREILDAVEPGGCITRMCATLGTMTRSGYVLRKGVGQGHVRYIFGNVKPRRDNTRTDPPLAPKRKLAAVAKTRTQQKGTVAESATPMTGVPVLSGKTNFSAALGTVCHTGSAKADASQRIAHDIKTFHRSGGRIDKLDFGASANPLRFNHQAAPAAPSRKRHV